MEAANACLLLFLRRAIAALAKIGGAGVSVTAVGHGNHRRSLVELQQQALRQLLRRRAAQRPRGGAPECLNTDFAAWREVLPTSSRKGISREKKQKKSLSHRLVVNGIGFPSAV